MVEDHLRSYHQNRRKFWNWISIGEFPQVFKHANKIPIHKKKEKSNITNHRPVAYYQTFLKFTKN